MFLSLLDGARTIRIGLGRGNLSPLDPSKLKLLPPHVIWQTRIYIHGLRRENLARIYE